MTASTPIHFIVGTLNAEVLILFEPPPACYEQEAKNKHGKGLMTGLQSCLMLRSIR